MQPEGAAWCAYPSDRCSVPHLLSFLWFNSPSTVQAKKNNMTCLRMLSHAPMSDSSALYCVIRTIPRNTVSDQGLWQQTPQSPARHLFASGRLSPPSTSIGLSTSTFALFPTSQHGRCLFSKLRTRICRVSRAINNRRFVCSPSSSARATGTPLPPSLILLEFVPDNCCPRP